jgi:hypothetical protein
MNTRYNAFRAVCLQEFAYLHEFGFALNEAEIDDYGCRVSYKNATTGLRADLERSMISVDCYKLIDGNFPKYPIFFNPSDDFLVFDVNDLFILRLARKVEQDPERMYEIPYMEGKVKEFSNLLRECAGDIFAGDFAILPKIKERVVRRAKELEHEQ